ncbi:glutaredoxin domain-containing protein [Vibrio breoganii]
MSQNQNINHELLPLFPEAEQSAACMQGWRLGQQEGKPILEKVKTQQAMFHTVEDVWRYIVRGYLSGNQLHCRAVLLLKALNPDEYAFLMARAAEWGILGNVAIEKNFAIQMFTKDGCNYCDKAKVLLSALDIGFEEVKVGESISVDDMKSYFHSKYNYTLETVPQFVVDGVHIEGWSGLKALLSN